MLGLSGIVRIFEEIEQRLVQSLRRNLSRHKEEEEQEEKQWSAWQAEKLRSLEKFRRENAAIMAEYTEQIDQETRQIMEEEFSQGVNSVDVLPAVPVEDAPAEIHPEPQFFGVDRAKVDKLIEDVTTLEKNAETAALRLTDDVYRQTVNRVQLAMSTGSMTLQQAIDIAVKDFLAQGINCIVYRDGRRVNIADYVRMALRTTATRAALQGKSAKFKALGYDTVQVSSYGMCSKTCEPWQGRIYIEDTFSDWDGEVQESPDGILWGKSGYCGKWFPLLSSAIEKGLFHPNCRHTILLWRDGDPLPESVDNSDSERRYKLEQQQRALEREIRKAKRKVNGFTDPENVRKAKAELRQAQKELKDFIDKVNAEEGETVLKRDEGKEKVYEGEVKPEYKTEPPVSDAPVPEGKAAEVTLDAPQAPPDAYRDTPVPEREGLIMGYKDKFSENSKLKTDYPETIVDKSQINSPEYRRKFDAFDESTQVKRTMCQESRNMLNHRSGTIYEDLTFIDSKTSKFITRTDYNYERSVKPSKRMYKMLHNSAAYSIIAIHNHPGSYVPSIDDIGCAYERKYKYGLIACHNGNIFKYKVTGKFNPIIVNSLLDKMQILLYNRDDTAIDYDTELLKTLKQLKGENVEMEVLLWQ